MDSFRRSPSMPLVRLVSLILFFSLLSPFLELSAQGIYSHSRYISVESNEASILSHRDAADAPGHRSPTRLDLDPQPSSPFSVDLKTLLSYEGGGTEESNLLIPNKQAFNTSASHFADQFGPYPLARLYSRGAVEAYYTAPGANTASSPNLTPAHAGAPFIQRDPSQSVVTPTPSTIGVYRPSTATFFLRNSNTTGSPDITSTFESPNAIPVAGDWNGDGIDTRGVFRNGTFYLSNSNTGSSIDIVVTFGVDGDQPVVGDWNNDNIDTIGIYRGDTFLLRNTNSLGNPDLVATLGANGDIGISGDWNNDGTDTIGVFRPSNGALYLRNTNTTGVADITLTYGIPNDRPVTGDWNGDGTDTIGVYRNGDFLLRNTNTNGFADIVATLGSPGDLPLAGRWVGGPPPPPPPSTAVSSARLDPYNRTGLPGEDLLSGNYNWSLPIVGLPGRAGLDLGLSLSYNSLIWTKAGSAIKFDADNGYPSPGFRLGFPVIQQKFVYSLSNANTYMLITPSGTRVELRQVGASNKYMAVDSSYLELTENSGTSLLLRSPDGTQLSYTLLGGEFRCTKVRDRNGNFISASYNGASGRLESVTDTLGRVINFTYSGASLDTITQQRGSVTHVWADFDYAGQQINTSFAGLTVDGPQNGASITVVSKVTVDDGSRYEFDYTSWGQVYRIRHLAPDGHLLNHVAYNLPQTAAAQQSDCPRFTRRDLFAENWNSGLDAQTHFDLPAARDYGQMTTPDGTIHKETFDTSATWKRGLPTLVEVKTGSTVRKSTALTWTQDDTGLAYKKNPRVTQSIVTDEEDNERKAQIDYQLFTLPNGSNCHLPSNVKEFDADGTSVLRRRFTGYNMGSTYTDKHIIGLVSEQTVYDDEDAIFSKVTYGYDDLGEYMVDQGAAIQHDNLGYTAGRANLTLVKRWDNTAPTDSTKAIEVSRTGYNTNGSPILIKDALRTVATISYTDSFSDSVSVSPATFAYPTTTSEAGSASFASFAQYDYYIGVVRQATDPKGAVMTYQYDAPGRLTKSESSCGAYTRAVYSQSLTLVESFSLIEAGAAEFKSIHVLDGAGRPRGSARELPGSVGGYSAQKTVYDQMGRVKDRYNPIEISLSASQPANIDLWLLAGDDQAGPWNYIRQTYDWQGRPLITTNSADNTTKTLSYEGCGCAGGETVTIEDEAGRTQKVFRDLLGRVKETRMLDLDGVGVQSRAINTYNAGDQITKIEEQAGLTGTIQTTWLTYDGHGRLFRKRVPIQSSTSPDTEYLYYADDRLQKKTDPRDATATFAYNSRGLVETIDHRKPQNESLAPEQDVIPAVPLISFGYDVAGNRSLMTYGANAQGKVTYEYDTWSRLKKETKEFEGLAGSFALEYDYNLTGQLKKVTEPFGADVYYTYNHAGQLQKVGATPTNNAYASGIQYRAWGAMKAMDYGNGLSLSVSFTPRLQTDRYDVKEGGTRRMGWEYDYDPDGRVRFLDDLINHDYDRSFTYDYAGRVKEAKTGNEARGELNISGPYRHLYFYDAWNNLNARTGRNTLSSINYTATYINNRNQDWSYNASGDVTIAEGINYVYDAAGRLSSENQLSITQLFDGDNLHVKRTENGTTKYFLRSSVLGGQVVIEMNASALKLRTYVYAGGERIAKREGGEVFWYFNDPASVSSQEWKKNASGNPELRSRVEKDPLGVVTGPLPFGSGGNVNPIGFYGTPTSPAMGCHADGIPTPCNLVARWVDNGIAVPAPTSSTTRAGTNPFTNQTEIGVFRAFADGFSGYLYQGTRYAGNGSVIRSSITITVEGGATYDTIDEYKLSPELPLLFVGLGQTRSDSRNWSTKSPTPPAKTPKPKCPDDWDTNIKNMNEIARTIGGYAKPIYRGPGDEPTEILGVTMSYSNVVSKFKYHWDPHLSHWGGTDLKVLHNNSWYHLTVYYPYKNGPTVWRKWGKDDYVQVETKMRDYSLPAPRITIHCDPHEPGTFEHFRKDFLNLPF